MAARGSDDAAGYALPMLRTAGLFRFRREGRVVVYRLADRFTGRLPGACGLALRSPATRGGGGAR